MKAGNVAPLLISLSGERGAGGERERESQREILGRPSSLAAQHVEI